jgi:hypothetical protein
MDVYTHMVINDDLDVCYDTFQPMLGPVYDTSIVRSHTSDAAAPSIAHDHEHALAGMFPKQGFGILPGLTDRYIASRHLCPETCPSTALFCPPHTDQCCTVTPVSLRAICCGSRCLSVSRTACPVR